MRFEARPNVLAPKAPVARAGDFLLNLGWSLYWLTRSLVRALIYQKRKGL